MANINLQTSTILMIDTSYYIFNRFHATARWFSFKEPEIEVHLLTENKEFIEAFFKHYNQDLFMLCKKNKIVNDNILWCIDAPRSEIWRMKLHTEYKGTREHLKFDKRIFPIFYEYLMSNGQRLVQCPTLEADDVIALIHETIRENDATHPILIITNDNDYLQLCSIYTRIQNMQGRDIFTRGSGDAKKDVLIKILMGDKSDNIPAVYPKCGPKTAIQLAEMSEEERFAELERRGALVQYKMNETLIRFDCIPDELRTTFKNLYQINILRI